MKTLHKRCAGLDVHKTEVVACLRVANRGKPSYEVRRFPTTTRGLMTVYPPQSGSIDFQPPEEAWGLVPGCHHSDTAWPIAVILHRGVLDCLR
jgi:hypothetical protein